MSDSSADRLLPTGVTYDWSASLIWLHAIPDLAIAITCFAVPFLLVYIARRRRDLKIDWLLIAFGLGVVATGIMHLLEAWNIWHTQYWLQAIAKILAAASLVPTALLLWRYLPDILSLPSQRQLREANESLARANRELEAFTASVSHDLRSPLTTIAGQAGLLELSMGANATEEQRRRLQRIQGSVKQMSDLIEALLVLSRISRHTLKREIVDVSAIVESVIADLRQKDPGRQVEVSIQPGMAVHGDRRLISDLIMNLVSNAWKFTSKVERARIEVGQEVHGSMATLYVRDNGAGFDMAYAQKLFKPFQRLHAPSEFEGSGVGLATVARIVDRHGGRIWAEGKANEGAVFYCTLPVSPITDEILLGPRTTARQAAHS
ncbi:MAG TPA: ATP-binding protein [Steroidobacteraceae bacterium]